MCLDCGYTSTSLNLEDSPIVRQYEETAPELFKLLRWIDPQTKLVWYPIVLNFPSFGMIFPDGTSVENWQWMSAPAVDIPFNDQKKYPIPGAPNKYYTKRVDLKKGKYFPPDQFYQAAKFIGFVQSDTNP